MKRAGIKGIDDLKLRDYFKMNLQSLNSCKEGFVECIQE